jgi:hypothetical protein
MVPRAFTEGGDCGSYGLSAPTSAHADTSPMVEAPVRRREIENREPGPGRMFT